jgi:DNA repair protein RadC
MAVFATDIYALRPNNVFMGEHLRNYELQVKDMPEPDRPRERLVREGPQALDTPELLAAILGVGTRKEEVLVMARRILKEYGDKSIASETSPKKMAEALDIPVAKACQVIAAFEIGRRFYTSRNGKPIYIRNAQQAYEHLQSIGYSAKEQLRGLYLNSRYQVVHDEIISVGSLTANIVHPREVFGPAIERGAVAIIIAHNHPSGDPTPTDADITVTKQLQYAGKVLGIELLDHLIIADDTFITIKEN